MAKEKAQKFLDHLKENPALLEMMKGFTQEELKSAIADYKKQGKLKEDELSVPHTF